MMPVSDGTRLHSACSFGPSSTKPQRAPDPLFGSSEILSDPRLSMSWWRSGDKTIQWADGDIQCACLLALLNRVDTMMIAIRSIDYRAPVRHS